MQDSLDELARLAETAGAEVIDALGQRLPRRTPYYLGKGKLEELRERIADQNADLVILDDELTPTQQRNLENALHVKVIDRAALIIDIFARHARTREGQLQVELAQHEYLLPRLAGQWSHLERLGAGIGTRGPGETQIETDRRLIRGRIQRLKKALESVRTHRNLYRQRRKQAGLPLVALVGYTNAGKSTLFNTITKSRALVQDQLFATLDPLTRKARSPSGEAYLITDTVGFIDKLPHALVAAFRATLEELVEADVLVHVVDVTHTNAGEQFDIVVETLRDMRLDSKPIVVALNKIDAALPTVRSEDDIADAIPALGELGIHPNAATVLVSAAKGWGIQALLREIDTAPHSTNRVDAPRNRFAPVFNDFS